MVPDRQQVDSGRLLGRHEDGQLGFDCSPRHVEGCGAVHAELGLMRRAGVVERMIGRRVPLLLVGIVEVKCLAGNFSRYDVRPVRRQPVLLGVDARARVQPAIGHHSDVSQHIGHGVIKRPRGERGVDQQLPAVLGELGVGLRHAWRDLAMLDRVDQFLRTGREARTGIPYLKTAGNQIDRLAPFLDKPDQQAYPGRAPRRDGQTDEQAADRVQGRMGRGVQRYRECQGFEHPRRPEAAGAADEINPRGQKTLRGVVRGKDTHGLRVLVPGKHGMQAA